VSVRASWSATLLGEPASKSNSRRLVLCGGRPRFIKTVKALAWMESARRQLAAMRPPRLLSGPLRFTARIYYASRRPDLDESLVLDALQGLVYANDRQVSEKRVSRALDRARPRVEVTVQELGRGVPGTGEEYEHDR